MDNQEAIKIIRDNWPPDQYSMLRDALELAIGKLQEKPIASHAVLDEGWRDARKELPGDGEQVLWAVGWKGNCDQGLESSDEYEYIYGRYYDEMEVIRLPWSDKEYKVKHMNYWRRIDPPAFV